jgi:hypothetical protein
MGVDGDHGVVLPFGLVAGSAGLVIGQVVQNFFGVFTEQRRR